MPNKLPPSLQAKARQDLHAIYEAANRQNAERALDRFVAQYGAKHAKATACSTKDRDSLLAFYGFPAAHGKHVRRTNPIASTFATVRLRTARTKGCLSRQTAPGHGVQARAVRRAALAQAGRLAKARSGDRGRALPRRRARASQRGAGRHLTSYTKLAHGPPKLRQPLILLLHQHGTDEADDGRFVWADNDDIGPELGSLL